MKIQKVAIIFDDQLRPETTGSYCLRALRELVEVEHVLPSNLNAIREDRFDLFLNIDDGIVYEFPARLQPRAIWAIDTHMNFDFLLKKSLKFDHVFTAQKDGAVQFQANGLTHSVWLPLACDPAIHKPHELAKEWDICFVGNPIPGVRDELLQSIRSRFSKTMITKCFFEEMAQTYSASKIVFNRSVKNDINMRVFEALACGSLLLTNDLSENGQSEMFQDGVHYVTYKNEEDLLEKIDYYLKHEKEREQIARRGLEHVGKHHTYRHRMETILNHISDHNDHDSSRFSSTPKSDHSQKEQAYFEFDRPEIRSMIPSDARTILDIGCGAGALGEALKKEREVTVWGIEREKDAGDLARTRLDHVISADIGQMNLEEVPKQFDCIVFADVLEHLRDPKRALGLARNWLNSEGRLIASIPNSRNHAVLSSLLKGNWTYESAGLLDEDHVRSFTRSEIEKMFFRAGFQIEQMQGTMLPDDQNWMSQQNGTAIRFDDLVLNGLDRSQVKEMAIYQFLVETKKDPHAAFGKTSIVIVTHNQLDYTRGCLSSIRHFTDEDFELIVVDNGSTDGTVDYLKSMTDVRLICNETNRGFPAAANQGIKIARGQQILLLNNDVLVTTGWLRRMLDTLNRENSVGLVGPVSNSVSGSQQIEIDYRNFSNLDGFAWERGRKFKAQTQSVERLVGFCLLIDKKVIETIGRLDERFGIGCYEDDDFCRRAKAAGFQAVIALDSFIHHFGSRTFLGSGVDFGEVLEQNRLKFENKWNGTTPENRLLRDTHSEKSTSLALPDGNEECLVAQRTDVRLSLCMIVRDNEKTIEDCLKSIKPWVDEIVVVDTGSTDRTKEICQQYGARLFDFSWIDDFSAARNESIRYARGEWIFWMDSDDTISQECGQRLRQLADSDHPQEIFGYVMQVHCPNGKGSDPKDFSVVDHIKMFRNRPDLRFEHRIHEQILPAIRRAGGQVAATEIYVVHSGSDQSREGCRRKLKRDYRILEKDLREKPDHPFVLYNLGMTLADDHRFEEALQYLRRCLENSAKEESHRAKAYSLLVNAFYQLKRYQEALESCATGLAEYPQDRELLFRKAMLKHRSGELKEAASIYESILCIQTKQDFASVDTGIFGPKTRHNLAIVYQDLENWNRAEKVWQETVKQHPHYRAGWRGLGEYLIEQEKYDDLFSLTDHPDLKYGFPSLHWTLRSKVSEKREFFREAIRILEEGNNSIAGDQEILRELCRLLFAHGQPAEVETLLERLAKLDDEDPAVWHNLACVKIRLGKPLDAVNAYRRSLEYRPDSEMTWTHLAEAYRSAGMKESAQEALQKANELKPATNLAVAGDSGS